MFPETFGIFTVSEKKRILREVLKSTFVNLQLLSPLCYPFFTAGVTGHVSLAYIIVICHLYCEYDTLRSV